MEQKILFIYRQNELQKAIMGYLTRKGYTVLEASTVEEALRIIKKNKVGVCLSELIFPDGNIFDFYEASKTVSNSFQSMVCVEKMRMTEVARLVNVYHVYSIFIMPVDVDTVLLPAIDSAFSEYSININMDETSVIEHNRNMELRQKASHLKKKLVLAQDSLERYAGLINHLASANVNISYINYNDDEKNHIMILTKRLINKLLLLSQDEHLSIETLPDFVNKDFRAKLSDGHIFYNNHIATSVSKEAVLYMTYAAWCLSLIFSLKSKVFGVTVDLNLITINDATMTITFDLEPGVLDIYEESKLPKEYLRVVLGILSELTTDIRKDYVGDSIKYTLVFNEIKKDEI